MTNIDLETTRLIPAELKTLRRKLMISIILMASILIPLLSLSGIMEPQAVNKLGRYLTFAICAIGIDLAWGYTGILGLCQAAFFTLGGYAMGMFLSLPTGGGDVRPEYHNIPQFFFFNNVDTLPLFWKPFAHFPLAFLAGILVPALFASILGFFVFRSRVKGVYFTIITQAIAWGVYLAFCRNEMLLGGTNGLTNFYKPLNQNLPWILGLYLLTLAVLAGVLFLSRYLTESRLGRLFVSIRDKEMLLNFIGYQPHLIKTFVFATAAGIAGLAGMLYVPQNGIITPNIMRVEDSIWMVIWVALGGRGHLWGALFGALATNYAFSILTSDLPSVWPFIQGGMFLMVVLLFPDGFSGIYQKFERDYLKGKSSLLKLALIPAAVILFAILSKTGLIPLSFTEASVAATWIKYGLLSIPLTIIIWKEKSSAGIVLAVLSAFFITEILGLMPKDLHQDFLKVPLKYYFLFIALILSSVRHHRTQGVTP